MSPFDTNIFKHLFRSSHDTKITDNNENNFEIKNANNQYAFSISQSKSESTNHDHRKVKHMLSDFTVDIADTDHFTRFLHKSSEHQEHPSSKLQSTSGEKHGHDTNEMFHKLTVRHTHELSSYEDEEDTRLRHTSSHVHASRYELPYNKRSGNRKQYTKTEACKMDAHGLC